MSEFFKLDLLRFGEGGDGASSGAEGESSTGEATPAGIPDRAKGFYEKAVKKTRPTQVAPVEEKETETASTESKMSYADLIKSDDYKEEHKAYMDKAIGDRLKKYKGIESDNEKMRNALTTVATKYGIDANDENFLDNLGKAIDEDDSYYEKYALERDLTPTDARKMVTMERRLAEQDRQRAEAEKKAQAEANFNALRMSADKTKQLYPDFNLEAEMQNDAFMRICFATNGDTTTAYRVAHWNDVTGAMVSKATEDAKNMTAQAIKSNQARPSEAGLSSQASANIETNFRAMNLEQIRAYAMEQKRKQNGR